MAMTITKAKAALKEELAGGTTAQAVEQAFLNVVNTNTEITSVDDISKITKAALLFTHSDKNKDEMAIEITKKLTNIMGSVQGKDLNDAKKIVNETLQPATTFTQQNTAPTQTDVGTFTNDNYKSLQDLMSVIELGDKLGLTSKRATKYLNNTLSDHEKISTTDLKDEIKAQVIKVQKKINTALQSKLKQLPQSDYNQSLQNKLKELDNGKVTKTEDYNDLYDSTTQLERDTTAINKKFDDIIINPKINDAGKDFAKELKAGWKDGKLETTIKELGKLDEDLKTKNPSEHQSLKKEYPSEQQSLKTGYPTFIRDFKGPNVDDSKDTNKENKGPSNRGPN